MKSDLTGMVQTVLGPSAPSDLGVTMPMEHILADASLTDEPPTEASAREIYFAPLSSEVLANVRYYGFRNLEDMRLGDISTAISEVAAYRQWGGGSLVDITPAESGRDPVGLARTSRSTGVNLVMSAGFGATRINGKPQLQEDLAARATKELTDGVGDTGIKAGLIGPVEIGAATSREELSLLRAAGSAQRETGAPLMLRPVPGYSSPLIALDVLAEMEADLSHVIVAEFAALSRSDMSEVMNAGCYGLFSSFGRPSAKGMRGSAIAQRGDAEQMEEVEWLVSRGLIAQLLISQEVDTMHRLFRFGGHGYFYILGNIVPRLIARGLSQEAVDRIISDNPSTALAFGEPKRG